MQTHVSHPCKRQRLALRGPHVLASCAFLDPNKGKIIACLNAVHDVVVRYREVSQSGPRFAFPRESGTVDLCPETGIAEKVSKI
jgi:adenylosuccinate synthase